VVGSFDPERHTLKKMAFMLGGGAAPGETFAIHMPDVYPDLGLIRIACVMIGASKTEFRMRLVAPPDRCWQLMGKFPEEGRAFRRPSGEVYELEDGRGGQMRPDFTRIREAAGLDSDVVPYTLRHTWATWFYAQTKDLLLLKTLGGWSKFETILHYTKQAPPDLGDRLLDKGWDFRQNLGKLEFEER